MRIDIATLFPEMCGAVLSASILGRAIRGGAVDIRTHDIRLYTENKHRRVDDKPYGGGTGMVIQAQPVYDCVMAIMAQHRVKPRIIYMSPQGEVLTQSKVKELSEEEGLILLCGHYEGIDKRVLDELEAEELSVGDYVLTGGELPALIVADAVSRLIEGVLPNEDAYSIESHYNGLLEFPQYTRPEEWRGRKVPETLLSGNPKLINEWQEREALEVTREKRPDMYEKYLRMQNTFTRRRRTKMSELDDRIDWEAQYIVAEKLGLRGYKQRYFKECKYIWGSFVPKQGQADSVQGELLREIVKLENEACDNGNINWDDNFAWFCGNIYDILAGSGVFGADELRTIKEVLDFIEENGEYARAYADGKIDDSECDPVKLAYVGHDLYDYLADAAARFYLANQEPIAYEHKEHIYR